MKTFLIFLLLIFYLFPILAGKNVNLPEFQDVKIRLLINSIPLGYEKKYGLDNCIQFDSLTFGDCINIYSLKLDSVLKNDYSIFKKSRNFLIPVLFKNQVVFFVTGKLNNTNDFQLMSLGANLFAQKFNAISEISKNIKNLAVLHEFVSGQSFLFDEKKLQEKKEFEMYSLNNRSNCYTIEHTKDEIVSSTTIIESYIKSINQFKSQKNEIVTY